MWRFEVFAASYWHGAGDAGGVIAEVDGVEGFLALRGAVEADKTRASNSTSAAVTYLTKYFMSQRAS